MSDTETPRRNHVSRRRVLKHAAVSTGALTVGVGSAAANRPTGGKAFTFEAQYQRNTPWMVVDTGVDRPGPVTCQSDDARQVTWKQYRIEYDTGETSFLTSPMEFELEGRYVFPASGNPCDSTQVTQELVEAPFRPVR